VAVIHFGTQPPGAEHRGGKQAMKERSVLTVIALGLLGFMSAAFLGAESRASDVNAKSKKRESVKFKSVMVYYETQVVMIGKFEEGKMGLDDGFGNLGFGTRRIPKQPTAVAVREPSEFTNTHGLKVGSIYLKKSNKNYQFIRTFDTTDDDDDKLAAILTKPAKKSAVGGGRNAH
jgi:hypothetical protein